MAFEAIGVNIGASQPNTSPPPTALPGGVGALADTLAQLRVTDPGGAATAQRQIEQALTPVERGQLAAAMDTRIAAAQPAWRQAFDAALAAPGAYAAFQRGVATGVVDGAKSLIGGTVELVGKTLQFGADVGLAGWAGDKLRGLTGQLPGAVDAVVPSNARGAQTAAGLREMGTKVGDYVVSRAQDPAKLATDAQQFITDNWNSLKADHAAAAARGPAAEAEWWGKVTGRAAFEIGITVVPVAGQAGKLATGARAAEGTVAATRVAETAGTIRNVNKIGGSMNCVNCTIATDAMLAGRPASALGGGPYRLTVLEKVFNARFGAPTTIADITTTMTTAGSGARGIVAGSRGSQVGHVFNVVNQNGVVRFLDGQTGQPATFNGFQSFRLLRTN